MGERGSTLDECKQRQKERGEEKRSREWMGREIDKENERGWAMVGREGCRSNLLSGN